jgi:hypothetical protein
MGKRPWRPASLIRPVPPPLPDDRPFVPQLVPRAGKLTELLAVHQDVVGYNMHFIDKRTSPCKGHGVLCEGCTAGLSQRWEGFLGCVELSTRKVWLLKVTAGAWTNSPSLQQYNGRLRGMQVACSRIGSHNNSPLRVVVFPAQRTLELPQPWDRSLTLARMWGYTEIGDLRSSEQIDMQAALRMPLEEEGGTQ